MKKFKIILVFLLVFFLVGCGEDDEHYEKPQIEISSKDPAKTDKEKEDNKQKENNNENKDNQDNKQKENNNENTDNKNYRSFISYDNKLSLKLPIDWKVLRKGELNEDANMELSGEQEDKFLMILSDSAKDFLSYSEWEKLAIKIAAETYSFDQKDAKDFNIEDYSGKWVEINYGEGSSGVYIRIYFFKIGNSYTQLYMWTSNANKAKYIKEFDDVLKTIEKVTR